MNNLIKASLLFLNPSQSTRFLWVLALALLLAGCTPPGPKPRQDPLLEKILLLPQKQEISLDQLLERAAQAEVIFLGEKHDNHRHHQIQMQVIQGLLEQGKSPVIGVELFATDQTSALMAYVEHQDRPGQKTDPKKLEEHLRRKLGWEHRPQEEWRDYFAFVRLAKEKKLTLVGLDLSQDLIRRISRVGLAGLTSVERAMIPWSNYQNASYQARMFEEFTQSHCGWSQKDLLAKLYQVWLARNDQMAQSIATSGPSLERPLVVLLGGGHARHGLAVPERLRALAPHLKQLNLGLAEITRQPEEMGMLFEQGQLGDKPLGPPHEVLWLTQRSSYEDPCVKFAEALRHHQPKQDKPLPPPPRP